MLEINQIVREIEFLPSESLQEIADFINYLKFKKTMNIPETMILSENSLAEYWDTPEEDEAWANL